MLTVLFFDTAIKESLNVLWNSHSNTQNFTDKKRISKCLQKEEKEELDHGNCCSKYQTLSCLVDSDMRGENPTQSVWGVIKLRALHSLEEDLWGFICRHWDLSTPCKKRSSTSKEKTCIAQSGSNHTGLPFIACTATTFRITVSLATSQRGAKNQHIAWFWITEMKANF